MFINTCDFLSGCAAGGLGILIGHPLDTVKVRQQAYGERLLMTLVTTYKNEGLRGYYKGCFFPVFTTGLTNALYFGFYANSLRYITGNDKKRLCCDSEKVDKWHLKMILAGGIGGLASLLTGTPVELVKVRLQSDKTRSIGTVAMFKYLYGKRGLRGVYKGANALALRDVPSFAAYATVYEHAVCTMESHSMKEEPKLHHQMIAGGLAGMVSWVPLMPLDVVKTRIQTDDLDRPKYKGIVDCFIKTFKSEGLLFFYRGSAITAMRAFPVNAVTFSAYSNATKYCDEKLYSKI